MIALISYWAFDLYAEYQICTLKGTEGVTQMQANVLYEGQPIDVENNISNFMNMILSCMFYSAIMPHAIPMALLGCILNYWITKYMLLKLHKMPEEFSELLTTFFANMLPYCMVVWSIAYLIFSIKFQIAWDEVQDERDVKYYDLIQFSKGNYTKYNLERLEYIIDTNATYPGTGDDFYYEVANAWKNFEGIPRGDATTNTTELKTWLEEASWSRLDKLDGEVETWAVVVLTFAILWQLLPIRYFLAKCTTDDILEKDDVKYSDRVIFFSNDYDTENPLTSQKGHERLI